MDIDAGNFGDSTVAEVGAALERAEFFSIDLEMSGISFADPVRAPSPTDSIALRYAKGRQVAKTFGIIQVGLAVFDKEGGCRTWNFHVFPRPVTEGPVKHTPVVALCSAGINFGRATGIDFQRWINKGLGFVDGTVEGELFEELQRVINQDGEMVTEPCFESAAWSKYLSPGASLSIDMSDAISREFESIKAFLFDNRTEYRIPNMRSIAALKGLLYRVRNELPPLSLYEQSSGAATDRYLSKKSASDLFYERLGFRRIWKLLTSCNKPLVVHNGLLDLLFCAHWFEAELPTGVNEFRALIKKLFPGGVFDTRLIALETGTSEGASLEALSELLEADEPFRSSVLLDEVSRNKYALSGSSFHEAAYDAFMTGCVFRALAGRVKDGLNHWRDTVCVARCYWGFSITGEDRLVRETGSRSKSIRYITGLSAAVSTRDILAVFDEIKGSGNGVNVSSIYVDWVTDTTALLIVSWSAEGDFDLAAGNLTTRLVEAVRNAQKGPLPALRLGGLDEFIRKQQEFAENGFSDESPEIVSLNKKIRQLE